MNPGGSRHVGPMYDALHPGERHEPQAQTPIFDPEPGRGASAARALLTIPGDRPRLVELIGETPDGAYLVAWHEVVEGFVSRKSMTVAPEWIGA